MRFLISILFFYLNNALAFEPHIAKYQLSINGFKIAEEVRTLHKLEDRYFYTANAKTSGVAALIKDYSIAASSAFAINDNDVNSIHYQIIEQEGGKFSKNYMIDVDSKNNTVMSNLTRTQPKILTWKSNGGNIVDPLSLFLALSYDLKNKSDQYQFSYQVADGKSIEQHNYQKTDNHTLDINGQVLMTIKVSMLDKNDNNIQAYFSPKHQYLPVLIEHTKQGRKYQYQLVDLEIKQPSEDQLQVSF